MQAGSAWSSFLNGHAIVSAALQKVIETIAAPIAEEFASRLLG
jgi:hypothetical protein